MPGLRGTPEIETTPESDADNERPDLARREMQLVHQKRELVRTEARVDVMKELASEIRSARRDVDEIKVIIAKLRGLAEAQRQGRRRRRRDQEFTRAASGVLALPSVCSCPALLTSALSLPYRCIVE
jgi:hypothetical protein